LFSDEIIFLLFISVFICSFVVVANGGLEELVRILKITSDANVLKSLAKVVVTMIPHPRELLVKFTFCRITFQLHLISPTFGLQVMHKDKSKHLVEKLNVLAILKKVLLTGFADLARYSRLFDSCFLFF
jgi:hypothetical protein